MPSSSDHRRFLTTRWSLVLAAGGEGSSASRQALEELCSSYWYPLYGYVRRTGRGPEEAADLTQDFFALVLERRDVSAADPSRGRFRSYLLGALKNFLANAWHKETAQKRGGAARLISIDAQDAEQRFTAESNTERSPEGEFARTWALTLLEQVLGKLRRDYEAADKGELFGVLQPTLTAVRDSLSYRDLGEQLDMREGAVKVAVHRLRQRYRELLRSEIAATVAEPNEIEDEIRGLFEALA